MRLAVFYLFLFLVQSFWGAWLAPYPAPDLFLLAVLTLLWRIPAWQLVLVGYGVGLLQDVFGHGNLGLHALGLAGGAMGALIVRSQLSRTSWLERSLAVLAALLGKWLAMAPLIVWQTGSLFALGGLWRVLPLEIILTLLFALWVLPWAEALMERARVLRKELL
jgi:rod shape-determining protein MreD